MEERDILSLIVWSYRKKTEKNNKPWKGKGMSSLHFFFNTSASLDNMFKFLNKTKEKIINKNKRRLKSHYISFSHQFIQPKFLTVFYSLFVCSRKILNRNVKWKILHLLHVVNECSTECTLSNIHNLNFWKSNFNSLTVLAGKIS
jgi:hypothetical protein